MTHHALKSLGLSSLFLAGVLSMLSTTACVAPGVDSPCEPGGGAESAHGAWACDEDEAEESAGDEAPSGEEDVPALNAPASTPQALCSPICDRP